MREPVRCTICEAPLRAMCSLHLVVGDTPAVVYGPKVCGYCGRTFSATQERVTTCSRECSLRLNRPAEARRLGLLA